MEANYRIFLEETIDGFFEGITSRSRNNNINQTAAVNQDKNNELNTTSSADIISVSSNNNIIQTAAVNQDKNNEPSITNSADIMSMSSNNNIIQTAALNQDKNNEPNITNNAYITSMSSNNNIIQTVAVNLDTNNVVNSTQVNSSKIKVKLRNRMKCKSTPNTLFDCTDRILPKGTQAQKPIEVLRDGKTNDELMDDDIDYYIKAIRPKQYNEVLILEVNFYTMGLSYIVPSDNFIEKPPPDDNVTQMGEYIERYPLIGAYNEENDKRCNTYVNNFPPVEQFKNFQKVNCAWINFKIVLLQYNINITYIYNII